MRRLKCPRCGAMVELPEGHRPYCPACGHGTPPAGRAGTTVADPVAPLDAATERTSSESHVATPLPPSPQAGRSAATWTLWLAVGQFALAAIAVAVVRLTVAPDAPPTWLGYLALGLGLPMAVGLGAGILVMLVKDMVRGWTWRRVLRLCLAWALMVFAAFGWWVLGRASQVLPT